MKNLPTEQRREAFNQIKAVEDANGVPMVRYSYRELRNTVEFIQAHQGLGDARFDDFLLSYNPSERALIHSMVIAKTEEQRSAIERKVKNEAMKTRKACRAALERAAPQELEQYDKKREVTAKKNKQTNQPRIPAGCSRPMFGPTPY